MNKTILFKILTVILVAAMLATSLCILASCENAEEETPTERTQEEKETVYTIGVLADPQVLAESAIDDPSIANTYFYKYNDILNCPTKMLDISAAIFKTAVDNLIAEQVDVVFFIGDLAETGGYSSELIILEGCEKLKAAGIPVYLANGVCDTASIGKGNYVCPNYFTEEEEKPHKPIDTQDFKKMFAEFGYNQAAFQDTNSISYAADIPGTNYRVLMLENTAGYTEGTVGIKNVSVNPISDAQLAWIESVLQDSQRIGKEVFVISSLPIDDNPVSYYTIFMDDAYLTMDQGAKIQKMFFDYGVNYVFSGHVHIDASSQRTDANGNILNEITTTSLAIYPSAYGIVEIKDDFTYLRTTKRLSTINESYLPSYVTAETRAAVTSDFNAYAKTRFKENFVGQRTYDIDHKHGDVIKGEEGRELVLDFMVSLEMYPAYVKNAMGKDTDVIDEETNELLEGISHDINLWMRDVNAMKLYGEGHTVEGILKPYGVSMPESDYKNATVFDYVMDTIYSMLEGTFVQRDVDVSLLTNIFYAGCKQFAGIDLLKRLHEVDDVVKSCDVNTVVDNFIASDIMDIKDDDFILCVISLFYPYLRDEIPMLFAAMKNLTDAAALLENFALIMPIISNGIPELVHFTNDKGELEADYVSLSKGEIYGKALITQIFFPVIARTAIIL